MPKESPILPNGFLWNEAELDRGHPLNASLVSLLVFKDGEPHLVGTGFIVKANGAHATALTAAHCFDEALKVLHPNRKHAASALPEFLPKPPDLDVEKVKAVYMAEGQVAMCAVELAIWDSAADKAFFTIKAPPQMPNLFQKEVLLDDDVPRIGELVAMIGFGEMQVLSNEDFGNGHRTFSIQRRLVLRAGKVEAEYPEGSFMVKGGPSIETSIAVYGGMSGGIVARLGESDAPIRAFGFVSHSPNTQPVLDRSKSGQSVAGILPMEKVTQQNGTQEIRLIIKPTGKAGVET